MPRPTATERLQTLHKDLGYALRRVQQRLKEATQTDGFHSPRAITLRSRKQNLRRALWATQDELKDAKKAEVCR